MPRRPLFASQSSRLEHLRSCFSEGNGDSVTVLIGSAFEFSGHPAVRQFGDERPCIVQLPQGFQDAATVDGNVPGLLVAVDEVAHQSMPVAIEIDADELAGLVEDRTAGIAADGVGGGYEIEGGACIQLSLFAATFRQVEWIRTSSVRRGEGTAYVV